MLKFGLIIAVSVTLVDQVAKWVVLNTVLASQPMVEVLPILNITLVWNRGVSFGFFGFASPWTPIVLSGFAGLVTIFLVAWLRRVNGYLLAIGLGLVIGGAVGNVIDRMHYGAVIDFIDLHAGKYHWPAFNVADSSITIGIIILLFDGVFARRQSDR